MPVQPYRWTTVSLRYNWHGPYSRSKRGPTRWPFREFQAQQSSQLGQLEKIALLVRADTPGIELDEHLTLESDFEDVRRKLKSHSEKGRGN
jgi:hypothetical protein